MWAAKLNQCPCSHFCTTARWEVKPKKHTLQLASECLHRQTAGLKNRVIWVGTPGAPGKLVQWKELDSLATYWQCFPGQSEGK